MKSNAKFVAPLLAVISLLFATGTIVSAKTATKQPARKAVVTTHAGAAGAGLTNAYNAYLARLRDKLHKHWYLPDGRNHVQLSVNVAPDGSVTELALKSNPQNPAAEQAASDAFNQSQPLEALPAGSASVRLVLNFDSNADPHGDSSRNITSNIEPIKAAEQKPAEQKPAEQTPAEQTPTETK